MIRVVLWVLPHAGTNGAIRRRFTRIQREELEQRLDAAGVRLRDPHTA